ncbi:MAG TPA: histidine phosphatase family protein, partial [Saprospiraceae bacterium]|nr:histidine phosphatase family protein [Saprospiraceae bacterium]
MKLNHLMLTFLCTFSAFFLFACEKEPQIIIKTETITIIDTLVVTDTFTIVETIFETQPDTSTTFILVRHAETTGAGSNPVLSAEGEIRANELSRIMTEVDLDAIYSTNFNRTMMTAQVTASAKGLTVSQYDPFNPVMLIDNVLEDFPEGIV